MIQLNSKPLDKVAVSHLNQVQQQIDNEPDFDARASRAKQKWDSKTGSNSGQSAFAEIKKTLVAMCVSVQVCNYCENNEANDVEHIYPKSLFPERAFDWDNYLLACKTCNTTYKSDNFAVFDPIGSATQVDMPRNNVPATDDAVLVDPRADNPLDFFWLDIESRTFNLDPKLGLTPRDKQRARYTLKLLGLNDRETLVAARKSAANYYLDRLQRFINTRDAQDFDQLEACVQDPDLIDVNVPLAQEKQRICQQIINDIQTYAHPTVWHELIRQRTNLPRTNRLLDQAPKALTW